MAVSWIVPNNQNFWVESAWDFGQKFALLKFINVFYPNFEKTCKKVEDAFRTKFQWKYNEFLGNKII